MSKLIHSVERLSQPIAFDGIKKGLVHPTDIDALLEFDDRYLFLFELKKKGNKVPLGQKLALQRIANAWIRDGEDKKAWVIYCEHDTSVDELVYLAKCKVLRVFNGKTTMDISKSDIVVVRFLNYMAKKYNIKKLLNESN